MCSLNFQNLFVHTNESCNTIVRAIYTPTVLIFSAMSEEGLNWLYELLQDVQLSQFLASIRDDLQITRLEHFDYVKPEDLEKVGLSKPGVLYLIQTTISIVFEVIKTFLA